MRIFISDRIPILRRRFPFVCLKCVCIQCAWKPKPLLFTGDSDTDVCIPTKLRNPKP